MLCAFPSLHNMVACCVYLCARAVYKYWFMFPVLCSACVCMCMCVCVCVYVCVYVCVCVFVHVFPLSRTSVFFSLRNPSPLRKSQTGQDAKTSHGRPGRGPEGRPALELVPEAVPPRPAAPPEEARREPVRTQEPELSLRLKRVRRAECASRGRCQLPRDSRLSDSSPVLIKAVGVGHGAAGHP